ncbi:unnamed protein product [Ectocarpus sp. 13 AM-2016]
MCLEDIEAVLQRNLLQSVRLRCEKSGERVHAPILLVLRTRPCRISSFTFSSSRESVVCFVSYLTPSISSFPSTSSRQSLCFFSYLSTWRHISFPLSPLSVTPLFKTSKTNYFFLFFWRDCLQSFSSSASVAFS